MDINPYEPPREVVKRNRTGKLPIAAYVLLWLLCYSLPSLAVALSFYFPDNFGPSALFDRDGILVRMSLTVHSRQDIALPISFIGCSAVTLLLPLRLKWRIAALLAWFPLSLFQLFAIIYCLYVTTGFMYT